MKGSLYLCIFFEGCCLVIIWWILREVLFSVGWEILSFLVFMIFMYLKDYYIVNFFKLKKKILSY